MGFIQFVIFKKIKKEMGNEFEFSEVTLTVIAVEFFLLFVIGCIWKYIFKLTPKQLTWSFSILNATISTTCSVIYILWKAQEIVNFLWERDQRDGKRLLLSVDDFSAYFCIWFAVFNKFDLLFGLLFYPNEMGVLTCFIHHSFYILLMPIAMTGKIGPMQIKPFASAFLIFCLEEIPTLLLAIGHVFPKLRSDKWFGFSFFIFRICFHFCFLCMILYLQLPMYYFYIPTLPFFVHLYWFYRWVKYYTTWFDSVK